MNKITYLDGARLHRALVAGANNVLSRQDYLNKINVFPVPDGDTGTNMAFTLNSILDSTSNKIKNNENCLPQTPFRGVGYLYIGE